MNIYDEIAALINTYGTKHEAAKAAGRDEVVEAYRLVTLDLCNLVTSKGR